ncbi:unnamed protein product [Cochlearia groenlandica]
MERGQCRFNESSYKAEPKAGSDRTSRRSDVQCHEYRGFGHYKNECPNLKTKEGNQCFGCKGYGHQRTDCVNIQKKDEKSYVSWSESDSNEEEQGMMNMIAYLGVVESDSESDEESTTVSDNQALVGTLLKLRSENRDLLEIQLKLLSDNQKLIQERHG